MNKLFPILLTACSQVPSDLKEKCPEEIQALEQSCDLQNGTFKKEVQDARLCLGEEVRIVCSDPGWGEPKILTLKP